MGDTLNLDQSRLLDLKIAYHKAVSEGLESFHPDFCPGPLLTSYAKYLIEYGETVLGPARIYNVVAINEKTGEETVMTAYPCSHSQALTIKSKLNPTYSWRRIVIREVT